MAQQSIGEKAVARDALATYRKLDERINAQMLAAVHAAESSRVPATPVEAVPDSKASGLSGKGLPSALDTPAPGAGGRAVEGLPGGGTGSMAPPAAFRMGSRSATL